MIMSNQEYIKVHMYLDPKDKCVLHLLKCPVKVVYHSFRQLTSKTILFGWHKKKTLLSLCSEQARLILWEEEDQIDLTWQQKHADKINLRGSTRFNRLFLLTWIIQDVSSVGSSVWLPDVFSKDFILEPSGGLGSLHRNSPAWCKTRNSRCPPSETNSDLYLKSIVGIWTTATILFWSCSVKMLLKSINDSVLYNQHIWLFAII